MAISGYSRLFASHEPARIPWLYMIMVPFKNKTENRVEIRGMNPVLPALCGQVAVDPWPCIVRVPRTENKACDIHVLSEISFLVYARETVRVSRAHRSQEWHVVSPTEEATGRWLCPQSF